ncbi:MAG: mechanosensitive ion channel domain-containing protein [Syntrophobacteria bacterium]
MRLQAVRVFWFLSMLMFIFLTLSGGLAAQETKASQPSPTPEEKEPSVPSLAELSPLATELAERSAVLEKDIAAVFDLSAAEKSLAKIVKRQKKLSGQLQDLKTTGGYGYYHLAELKVGIGIEANSLQKTVDSLTEAINQTGIWETEWLNESKRWKELRSSVPKHVPLKTMAPTFARAQDIIDRSVNLIKQQLKFLLAAQQRAGEIQAGMYSLKVEVDDLLLAVRHDVWEKSAPSMFSSKYYTQFSKGLWEELQKGLSIVSWPGRQFLQRHGWLVFLQVFLSLALTASIVRHRSLLEGEERWRFIARRPLAAGIFVGFTPPLSLYGPIPGTWALALSAVVTIALARLVGGGVVKFWRKWLVYALAIFLITTKLLRVFGLPLPLFRLYVFSTALIGMVLCIWRSVESVRSGGSLLYAWILRLGGLVFLGVIIAEIGGYNALAAHVLESSLGTTFIVLAAWMLMLMTRGFLEWAMQSAPLKKIPFLQSKANVIVSRSALLANLLVGALLLTFILVTWRLYDRPIEAIQGLMSFGFTVGSRQVTVGLIFAAAAFLYGSFIISWAVQAMLMEGVFTRRQLQVGVRISMAKLVHYGFIFVGFLLALVALGVQLRDVTIIAGALGIGIGFGLQGIVVNLVSGLILLFERPIKVGDYIELGQKWAEIKKIGLRATVVETFDRAEVVVPNSDLVSTQVTNWTLSNRFIRLVIPVGVAYGSDVSLVMQTLMECAEANSMVTRVPTPKVFFLAFGESSLDFEVRVWISDVENRRQVQSDLHQEIDRRFRELGIEIAFPQRDLHLRSIDESVSSRSISPKGQPLSVVSREEDDGEGE